MGRRLERGRLLVASHNEGKVREIGDLVRPHGIEVVSAAALGLPEPEETGATFAENAELKARAGAMASGLPALADDSGLVVPALGGAPGIYSARWAETGPETGAGRDFDVAMRRVIDEIEASESRSRAAYFFCALALAWPGDGDDGGAGHVEIFEGRVDGTLVWPPRGDRGFGYDPIFQPDGHGETFGEMEPAKKHAMSHRADAFAKMIAAVFAPESRRQADGA